MAVHDWSIVSVEWTGQIALEAAADTVVRLEVGVVDAAIDKFPPGRYCFC